MKYKTIKLGVLLNGLVLMASAVNMAYVPKVAPGDTVDAGTGKQWPTTRFVVNGNCVTDNLTGLMWAKNGIIGFESTNGSGPIDQPNYTNTTANLNDLNWSNSKTAIDKMNAADYKLCGYGDWRLPNINELKSLINYATTNPSEWLNFKEFNNVQPYYYWSSTAFDGSRSWYVHFKNGYSNYRDVSSAGYVWPVRGGQ